MAKMAQMKTLCDKEVSTWRKLVLLPWSRLEMQDVRARWVSFSWFDVNESHARLT
jgi:hypothetical protein